MIMRDLSINKKGNLEDWGVMAWLVLSLVLSVFFVNLVLYNFNDKIQGMSTIPDEAKTIIQNTTTKAITILDNGVMLAYIFTLLLILYSAYFIKSNIKFALVGVLYLVFTIWIYPLLSEVGIGILTANAITSVVADLMPKSYWILQNLTLLQAVTWLLVMIMLYAKTRNDNETTGVSGSI